jgi:hypothetical protein
MNRYHVITAFPAHCSGIRRGPQRQVGRKIEFAKHRGGRCVATWTQLQDTTAKRPDAKNVNLTKCRQ